MALFKTQRTRMVEQFQATGRDFLANTMPYHSTRTLFFEVVNVNNAFGRPQAYAVARAGQELEFFGYGVGEQWVSFPVIGGTGLAATEAETNLGKAKSTNGAIDFVIEGVGMHCRGLTYFLPQTAGQIPQGGTVFAAADYVGAQGLDPDVFAAFTGTNLMMDPGGIVTSPQMFSPFNLEQAMFQAAVGAMSLDFEWDRRRTEKITVTDLLPQAGASSYLRANGEPSSKNRYCIDEGYLWRRDGETDSEFIASVVLQRGICIPLDIPATPNNAAAFITPRLIGLEIIMRLYGLSLAFQSSN